MKEEHWEIIMKEDEKKYDTRIDWSSIELGVKDRSSYNEHCGKMLVYTKNVNVFMFVFGFLISYFTILGVCLLGFFPSFVLVWIWRVITG